MLILTTYDLDEYVFGALRAGASGFLLKDASRDRLLEAIRVVHAGEALLSPSITRRLIEDYATRAAPVRPREAVLAGLTPGNGRSSSWWPGACRTRRSPRAWS